MTGLARMLRERGVAADASRLVAAAGALEHVDPLDPVQVYWSTRVTLCSEPDDLPRFDEAFAAWLVSPPPAPVQEVPVPAEAPTGPGPGTGTGAVERVAATAVETLRTRDVADLSAAERDEVRRLIALLAPIVGTRRSMRHRPGGRAGLDPARTLRAMLRAGGEPAVLAHRRRRTTPRRLVLLVDVSGSMSPYADSLLRFAHAAVRVRPLATEAFTVGTRLTRVTRALRLRDPEAALRAAAATVPDWSGGTRLGESLRAFLDLWGQRGAARGAVVVIFSDGWERGGADLLGEQAARLRRLAHAVIWVNPHKGKDGFEPETAGMRAALPHVDTLVAGHSAAALTDLVAVLHRA
ncbi:MAG TPA: VWA domain-containing protein [Mycobacteriales bacterium]|nr:VWA domain-containing protein [Mycobacteriales bacterium]